VRVLKVEWVLLRCELLECPGIVEDGRELTPGGAVVGVPAGDGLRTVSA